MALSISRGRSPLQDYMGGRIMQDFLNRLRISRHKTFWFDTSERVEIKLAYSVDVAPLNVSNPFIFQHVHARFALIEILTRLIEDSPDPSAAYNEVHNFLTELTDGEYRHYYQTLQHINKQVFIKVCEHLPHSLVWCAKSGKAIPR